MAVDTRFIDRSRKYLKANYVPKIETAVAPLAPDDDSLNPSADGP